MKILGIEFAPLNVPLQRRLQTLAAGTFITVAFGGLLTFFLVIYLLFTPLRWLVVLYLIWMFLDKDTCNKGGRPWNCIRNWTWWVYLREYFPCHLVKATDVELDPTRNYLFCCVPHGCISIATFNSFASNASEFKKLFPHHVPKIVTLKLHFVTPFVRELVLFFGGVSCSRESVNYVLSRPGGGNAVILVPSGTDDIYHSKPGVYKTVLNKRKGFIRLALINGTPLVPVVSFGESELYREITGPNVSKFQKFLKKYIGFAPTILMGRGYFQYTFGIIPHRKSVTTVVGTPIEFKRNTSPSHEEINELHQRFTEELTKLFEEQKHLYLENAELTKLEII